MSKMLNWLINKPILTNNLLHVSRIKVPCSVFLLNNFPALFEYNGVLWGKFVVYYYKHMEKTKTIFFYALVLSIDFLWHQILIEENWHGKG